MAAEVRHYGQQLTTCYLFTKYICRRTYVDSVGGGVIDMWRQLASFNFFLVKRLLISLFASISLESAQ